MSGFSLIDDHAPSDRGQTNLLSECMADVRELNNGLSSSESEFRQAWCRRCRNGSCVNSGWGTDPFAERVRTQLERFSNPVIVSSSETSKYEGLKDFREVSMEPLSMSDLWNVHNAPAPPKEGITVGPDQDRDSTGSDPWGSPAERKVPTGTKVRFGKDGTILKR